MATLVLTNARVEINAVVLSDHCRSVDLQYSAADVEDTNMGDSTVQRLAGLKDWSLSIEFAQDFAASNVDATLFALVGAAPFAVKIRPTTSAISATNPEYQGNVILTSYTPITGSVGDLATAPCEFKAAGDLTRAVA